MKNPFDGVQRIVLRGSHWKAGRHLVLEFGKNSSPLHFLLLLKQKDWWPTPAEASRHNVQVSLGFSRRGLERALVPDHVLAHFALKSPAFHAGAALRANRHLGVSGSDGPQAWEPAFRFATLDAVLSLHAMDAACLPDGVKVVEDAAKAAGVRIQELPATSRLATPPGETADADAQWVHFGYRDGLSHVGIRGWTPEDRLKPRKPISLFAPGEFLLGHPQDTGANPWIAGPGLRVWPEEIRSFFHNGSFGVLHQVEQHAQKFEDFVKTRPHGLEPALLKAKLCGRYTDGRPLGAPNGKPEDDFDYSADTEGISCPFGAHARRMNPRGDALPHAVRPRPLLRRGMPYGKPIWASDAAQGEKRGLVGQFFCSSIEDQFEHLVGQWADRVPLGSLDCGGARDPLIGAHEPGDGHFDIPQGPGKDPLKLTGLLPFTRTAGIAYLFYPSLPVLEGISTNATWLTRYEDGP